jgi:hypothetical protein
LDLERYRHHGFGSKFEEIKTDIFYHWRLDVEEDRAVYHQLRMFLGWGYHQELTDPVIPVVISANRGSVNNKPFSYVDNSVAKF